MHLGLRRGAALAFLLLSACATGRPEAIDPESIRIGVAGPMSGRFAAFGAQLAAGARQAVDDINAAGGLLGRPLQLLIGDDGCDSVLATRVAERFARAGVAFVDGHFCSGSSIPAAAVYDAKGVVMISPTSTNPALTRQGLRTVFRAAHGDDQQPGVVLAYLDRERPDAGLAVIHDGSEYGRTLGRAMAASLAAAGRKPILQREVRRGAVRFEAEARAVRAAGADTVFYGGYPAEAAHLAQALSALPEPPLLIGADALMGVRFGRMAGPAAEGTLAVFPIDASGLPTARDVAARLRATGVRPERYVLSSYAAVEAWAEAVRRAGTTDAAAVAGALRAGTFETVLGPLRFAADGSLASPPPLMLYRWSRGTYKPFWRPRSRRRRGSPFSRPRSIHTYLRGNTQGEVPWPPAKRSLRPRSIPMSGWRRSGATSKPSPMPARSWPTACAPSPSARRR